MDKGSQSTNFSLADFIAPQNDYIGLFAVTAGHGLDKIVANFENNNDDYNSIMVKVLADRLVEALAEKLHQIVRIEYWGYANNEKLTVNEILKEKYQGIRPAPGYPACPDHSEKNNIWKILDVEKNIGITLTENKAMNPASSICGWYFSHPNSKYFNL
tara:strand:- start:46 stop:519 length:474 start_codon:yes stop_codon:yes gene_type:complete